MDAPPGPPPPTPLRRAVPSAAARPPLPPLPPLPRPLGRRLLWGLGWVWALPVTALGVLLALPFARLARTTRGGVLHFVARGDGLLWRAMRRLSIAAFTLGATVTHADPSGPFDERLVRHEDAHVAQTLVLGPLFLPVYFLASGWAWLRGGDSYRDNWFEVRAREAER